MLNIDHHHHQQTSSSFCPSPSMGPRISFSNDFADSQQAVKIQNNYKEAPVSADFEFSVSNFNTFSSSLNNNSAADEIFFMGKLLPLKERKMTLRDELLASDHEDLIPQIPKGITWWKDRFSMMRRSGNDQKKGECLESVAEEKTPAQILDEDCHHTKKLVTTELNKEGLGIRDVKNSFSF